MLLLNTAIKVQYAIACNLVAKNVVNETISNFNIHIKICVVRLGRGSQNVIVTETLKEKLKISNSILIQNVITTGDRNL